MKENSSPIKACAVILAAGMGSRMRSDTTKQRLDILGRSVLYHSVRAFEICDSIDGIVVVVREDEIEFAKAELSSFRKIAGLVVGGDTRAASARIGFSSIPEDTELVAIHDAARPLIAPSDIDRVIKCAKECGAASAVSRVSDTIKRVDSKGVIIETLPRDDLRRAETPQVFSTEIYRRALSSCPDIEGITDDNMLVERIGVSVKAVELEFENIKITVPRDIAYAEFLLARREKL